ncbi:MAG TPA: TIGR04219 family outer membrane beta-barrel protein, partial [Marinagarivorans sp.]
MKKQLLASAIVLSSPSALADFIGVHGSIASWQSTFSGEIAGTAKLAERNEYGWGVPSFKERGFEKNGQYFGHIAFEHPIPLLPNIRLGYTKIEDSGSSPSEINSRRYDQIIEVNDKDVIVSWDIAQNIHTTLNIDALDLSLYYEVLDNWVNLDVGLTIRQMTGEFIESTYTEEIPSLLVGGSCSAQNLNVASSGRCIVPPLSQTTDIDFVVPMLYSEIRFDLPLSGLFLAGRGNAVSYSGNKVLDFEVEAGYDFDMTVTELGLALGYRRSSLKADDLEGLYSDATLDGFYTSLKVHF